MIMILISLVEEIMEDLVMEGQTFTILVCLNQLCDYVCLINVFFSY